eukprot:TRINITY_DN35640_c0_g1_i1.p1 TRINITY_DN35640_c0_g1~~TRINITY_DN35640_c0_g1_i1.p1  ORF type:complete len:2545 (-),score=932.39 TRINITY_DN35640_c0_g1_i1:413-8047(-)
MEAAPEDDEGMPPEDLWANIREAANEGLAAATVERVLRERDAGKKEPRFWREPPLVVRSVVMIQACLRRKEFLRCFAGDGGALDPELLELAPPDPLIATTLYFCRRLRNPNFVDVEAEATAVAGLTAEKHGLTMAEVMDVIRYYDSMVSANNVGLTALREKLEKMVCAVQEDLFYEVEHMETCVLVHAAIQKCIATCHLPPEYKERCLMYGYQRLKTVKAELEQRLRNEARKASSVPEYDEVLRETEQLFGPIETEVRHEVETLRERRLQFLFQELNTKWSRPFAGPLPPHARAAKKYVRELGAHMEEVQEFLRLEKEHAAMLEAVFENDVSQLQQQTAELTQKRMNARARIMIQELDGMLSEKMNEMQAVVEQGILELGSDNKKVAEIALKVLAHDAHAALYSILTERAAKELKAEIDKNDSRPEAGDRVKSLAGELLGLLQQMEPDHPLQKEMRENFARPLKALEMSRQETKAEEKKEIRPMTVEARPVTGTTQAATAARSAFDRKVEERGAAKAAAEAKKQAEEEAEPKPSEATASVLRELENLGRETKDEDSRPSTVREPEEEDLWGEPKEFRPATSDPYQLLPETRSMADALADRAKKKKEAQQKGMQALLGGVPELDDDEPKGPATELPCVMTMRDITMDVVMLHGQEIFLKKMRRALANALEVHRRRLEMISVEAGSVKINMMIVEPGPSDQAGPAGSKPPAAEELFKELKKQLMSPSSKLRTSEAGPFLADAIIERLDGAEHGTAPSAGKTASRGLEGPEKRDASKPGAGREGNASAAMLASKSLPASGWASLGRAKAQPPVSPTQQFRTTSGPPPDNEALPQQEGWAVPYKPQDLYSFFDEGKKIKAGMTKDEILRLKRPRQEQAAAFKLTRHPNGGTQKLSSFVMAHRPALGAATSWLEHYQEAKKDPLRETLARELMEARKAKEPKPKDDSEHPDVVARRKAQEAVAEACEAGDEEAKKKEEAAAKAAAEAEKKAAKKQKQKRQRTVTEDSAVGAEPDAEAEPSQEESPSEVTSPTSAVTSPVSTAGGGSTRRGRPKTSESVDSFKMEKSEKKEKKKKKKEAREVSSPTSTAGETEGESGSIHDGDTTDGGESEAPEREKKVKKSTRKSKKARASSAGSHEEQQEHEMSADVTTEGEESPTMDGEAAAAKARRKAAREAAAEKASERRRKKEEQKQKNAEKQQEKLREIMESVQQTEEPMPTVCWAGMHGGIPGTGLRAVAENLNKLPAIGSSAVDELRSAAFVRTAFRHGTVGVGPPYRTRENDKDYSPFDAHKQQEALAAAKTLDESLEKNDWNRSYLLATKKRGGRSLGPKESIRAMNRATSLPQLRNRQRLGDMVAGMDGQAIYHDGASSSHQGPPAGAGGYPSGAAGLPTAPAQMPRGGTRAVDDDALERFGEDDEEEEEDAADAEGGDPSAEQDLAGTTTAGGSAVPDEIDMAEMPHQPAETASPSESVADSAAPKEKGKKGKTGKKGKGKKGEDKDDAASPDEAKEDKKQRKSKVDDSAEDAVAEGGKKKKKDGKKGKDKDKDKEDEAASAAKAEAEDGKESAKEGKKGKKEKKKGKGDKGDKAEKSAASASAETTEEASASDAPGPVPPKPPQTPDAASAAAAEDAAKAAPDGGPPPPPPPPPPAGEEAAADDAAKAAAPPPGPDGGPPPPPAPRPDGEAGDDATGAAKAAAPLAGEDEGAGPAPPPPPLPGQPQQQQAGGADGAAKSAPPPPPVPGDRASDGTDAEGPAKSAPPPPVAARGDIPAAADESAAKSAPPPPPPGGRPEGETGPPDAAAKAVGGTMVGDAIDIDGVPSAPAGKDDDVVTEDELKEYLEQSKRLQQQVESLQQQLQEEEAAGAPAAAARGQAEDEENEVRASKVAPLLSETVEGRRKLSVGQLPPRAMSAGRLSEGSICSTPTFANTTVEGISQLAIEAAVWDREDVGSQALTVAESGVSGDQDQEQDIPFEFMGPYKSEVQKQATDVEDNTQNDDAAEAQSSSASADGAASIASRRSGVAPEPLAEPEGDLEPPTSPPLSPDTQNFLERAELLMSPTSLETFLECPPSPTEYVPLEGEDAEEWAEMEQAAAMRLQASLRGRQGRRHVELLKKQKRETEAEAVARALAKQDALEAEVEAAKAAAAEAERIAEEALRVEEEAAARKVQAIVRGRNGRRKVEKLKEENKAEEAAALEQEIAEQEAAAEAAAAKAAAEKATLEAAAVEARARAEEAEQALQDAEEAAALKVQATLRGRAGRRRAALLRQRTREKAALEQAQREEAERLLKEQEDTEAAAAEADAAEAAATAAQDPATTAAGEAVDPSELTPPAGSELGGEGDPSRRPSESSQAPSSSAAAAEPADAPTAAVSSSATAAAAMPSLPFTFATAAASSSSSKLGASHPTCNKTATKNQVRVFAQSLTQSIFRQSHGMAMHRQRTLQQSMGGPAGRAAPGAMTMASTFSGGASASSTMPLQQQSGVPGGYYQAPPGAAATQLPMSSTAGGGTWPGRQEDRLGATQAGDAVARGDPRTSSSTEAAASRQRDRASDP